MSYIKWFKDLSKEDIAIAGGKGANLGELTQAGIPVPPGFVVLSSAYYKFLEDNKLRPQIHRILSTCDVLDPAQLEPAAKKIQRFMAAALVPAEVAQEIFTSYAKIGSKTAVAVRSSATAEDLPEASFAGQQESYLNIIGDANVVAKVKACWMSLFGARSIFYRAQQKFDHFKVGIAVPVQTMIQSDISGIIFTVDPITGDRDKLVIEAIWGLGDYVVQGVVTPDHFSVSRSTGQIVDKNIATQDIMEIRNRQGVKQVNVPNRLRSVQKISDSLVLKLADYAQKIHQHYFFPQDIEWAIAKGKIYFVQSRPITTLNDKRTGSLLVRSDTQKERPFSPPILKGAPASPGIVSGPVKIILDIKNIDQVKKGDIMVTDMTTPDFVPAMKRAAGIITNRGGLTSHAAIVSRELGVPCVVGTTVATHTLKDGQIVTLNGSTGEVFKGALHLPSIQLQDPASNIQSLPSDIKTATKLYVNLAEAELAEKIAAENVDGVGLLRAEFMIAAIGTHPKKLIAEKRQEEFISKLTDGLVTFCKAFSPRPVVYRTTDFKTNEYRSLKGGQLYEPEESNPMLGFRGAYRYITHPEVFELELEAIKRVRNRHKLTNLNLMIPFVHTPEELLEIKKQVTASGLVRSASFKFWMMVEIPSNVILLDEFIDVGIDGVSIGSNDLTMLIMGVDRDNSEVASVFDERNPAVMWALEKTIKTCLKKGITCGICGQAPSLYPDLVAKLVSWGISSISVNPDAIARTRELIYNSELRYVSQA